MNDPIAEGAQMIREARKILVFTGAGLSTESGIPDFRSPGGVWDRYDPSDFYFQKIISDEKTREKYWKMSTEFYDTMKNAAPNAAHSAIRTLEENGKLLAVVTQNIDHLHHKAGNSPDKIIEIHGTAFSVSCLNCGKSYDRDEIQQRLKSGVKIPSCDYCSGILKPDTISFGQAMPVDKTQKAARISSESDLFMVVGSTLVVQPAALMPEYAKNARAFLIILNLSDTPYDSVSDICIQEKAGPVLDKVLTQVIALKT